jgi:aldose 1-epimerase
MTPFGTLPDERTVHALTLSAGALTVRVLTLGAILQSVRLAGVDHDLTLGLPALADYLDGRMWFGAIVGPVANRIGGARAVIGGVERRFEANFLGRHALHSGAASVCHKVWRVTDHGLAHAVLALDLPDGEGGFPGNRQVTARFDLTAPAALRLTITTHTDALTPVNFTNHSYWTMDGGPSWAGHHLRIAADHVLDLTDELIPTGGLRPVAGSMLDLRAGRTITPDDYAADDNYCVATKRRPLTEVLWLTGANGVRLRLATTEPGVQIYDGRAAATPNSGPYHALAIEAQGWPDALNHPGFPGHLAAPGETVAQITEWRFGQA